MNERFPKRTLVVPFEGAKPPIDGPVPKGKTPAILPTMALSRVCPVIAKGHCCNCAGACREPITNAELGRCLGLALKEVAGSDTDHLTGLIDEILDALEPTGTKCHHCLGIANAEGEFNHAPGCLYVRAGILKNVARPV